MLLKSCWSPAVLALLAITCTDSGGVPDDIGSACARQRECGAAAAGEDGLSYDERECRERLSAEYDEASGYGCGAAYADWVSCQATQRGNCPPPLVIDESSDSAAAASEDAAAEQDADPCQGAYDALRRCQEQAQRDE
jgi:hypothetical protein